MNLELWRESFGAKITFSCLLMGNVSPITCELPLEWEHVEKTTGSVLPGREGHGGVFVDGKIFFFGGIQDCAEDPSSMDEDEEPFPTMCMNDLYSFDVATRDWQKVECGGSAPSPRSGFVFAAVAPNQLFVYGGLDPLYGWMTDGFLLDTSTLQWTRIEFTGDCPSPRDKMASVMLPDGQLAMFGGFGPQVVEAVDGEEETATFGWFNDAFFLDFKKNRWSRLDCQGELPTPRAATGLALITRPKQVKLEKKEATTEGHPVPPPQYTEEGDAQHYLYIMGGRDNRGGRTNDCFSLELSSLTWEKQQVRGTAPVGRSFHTVVSVGDKLVVFGGADPSHHLLNDLHLLDTRADSQHAWVQPTFCETARMPRARAFHATTMEASVEGNCLLYIHGGTNEMDLESGEHLTFSDDLWRINLRMSSPSPLCINAYSLIE